MRRAPVAGVRAGTPANSDCQRDGRRELEHRAKPREHRIGPRTLQAFRCAREALQFERQAFQ